jgi:hypothetical protein
VALTTTIHISRRSKMTCKVVGFNGKVGKSVRKVADGKVIIRVKTAAELMSDPLFLEACQKTADKLDTGIANFTTKRQASKFFRCEGIVYKTIMTKEVNSAG